MTSLELEEDTSYALVVRQPGKAQAILFKYIVLIVNYRYGQQIVVSSNFNEGAAIMRRHSRQIRSVFIIQNEKIQNKMFVYAMGLQGKIPLFVLCPLALVAMHDRLTQGMKNIFVSPWERAFQKGKNSLGQMISENMKEGSLAELLQGGEKVPYEQLQAQVEKRVQSLQTLPAIPEIVLRIMRMVSDPNCNVETLEQLLLNDPSIVQKLIQVVNSPHFAGAGQRGKWNLKEAIVRLGLRKAGAIAQQVKLMNTFVKPGESMFDLQRFWEHSIGCAMFADEICTRKLLPLKTSLEFDTYWIACILHDIGKMILGYFFWDHFEAVVGKMSQAEEGMLSFREAEKQMGDLANHEMVGQLLLMKSNVRQDIVEAVSSHHGLEEGTSPMTCLLNLVNNISKDLGLGYLPDEKGIYEEPLLANLQISLEDVEKLKERLNESVVPEIKSLVELCLAP